jgi:aspartate aminotransferase
MIRALFEEGIKLKQKFGDNEVCDFSLGNPTLPPPSPVADALKELAENVFFSVLL